MKEDPPQKVTEHTHASTPTRRRGQIIKKGEGVFAIRVFLGYQPSRKNPHRRVRLYHYETFRGTPAKAQKRCTAILAQVDSGEYFRPSDLTVSGLFTKWFEHYRRSGARALTCEQYAEFAKRYVESAIGAIPLAALRPLDVQDVVDRMSARNLAPSTIRTAYKILNLALKQAVRWQLIKSNPAADISTPKIKKKKKSVCAPDEAVRFLQAAAAHSPDDLIFTFALCTGLRPSELIAVKWAGIRLETDERGVERGVVSVTETIKRHRKKTPAGETWYFDAPKTETSVREVYFPAPLYHQLQDLKRSQATHRLAVGPSYRDLGLVFCAGNGNPLSATDLTGVRLKRLLRRAELPESYTLYTLRRSFATLALLAGGSAKEIAEQMGHTDQSFTQDVYVQALSDLKRLTADRLRSLLFERSGTVLAHSDGEQVM